MKRLILGLLLGLGMVSIAAGPAQAFICVQWDVWPPYACTGWVPSNVPGFSSINCATAPSSGMVIIASGVNFTGSCFYTGVGGAGAEYPYNNFGDMDTWPGTPGFKIQSIKWNLGRVSWLYNGINNTGSVYFMTNGIGAISNFTSFQPSSIYIRN